MGYRRSKSLSGLTAQIAVIALGFIVLVRSQGYKEANPSQQGYQYQLSSQATTSDYASTDSTTPLGRPQTLASSLLASLDVFYDPITPDIRIPGSDHLSSTANPVSINGILNDTYKYGGKPPAASHPTLPPSEVWASFYIRLNSASEYEFISVQVEAEVDGKDAGVGFVNVIVGQVVTVTRTAPIQRVSLLYSTHGPLSDDQAKSGVILDFPTRIVLRVFKDEVPPSSNAALATTTPSPTLQADERLDFVLWKKFGVPKACDYVDVSIRNALMVERGHVTNVFEPRRGDVRIMLYRAIENDMDTLFFTRVPGGPDTGKLSFTLHRVVTDKWVPTVTAQSFAHDMNTTETHSWLDVNVCDHIKASDRLPTSTHSLVSLTFDLTHVDPAGINLTTYTPITVSYIKHCKKDDDSLVGAAIAVAVIAFFIVAAVFAFICVWMGTSNTSRAAQCRRNCADNCPSFCFCCVRLIRGNRYTDNFGTEQQYRYNYGHFEEGQGGDKEENGQDWGDRNERGKKTKQQRDPRSRREEQNEVGGRDGEHTGFTSYMEYVEEDAKVVVNVEERRGRRMEKMEKKGGVDEGNQGVNGEVERKEKKGKKKKDTATREAEDEEKARVRQHVINTVLGGEAGRAQAASFGIHIGNAEREHHHKSKRTRDRDGGVIPAKHGGRSGTSGGGGGGDDGNGHMNDTSVALDDLDAALYDDINTRGIV